MGVLGPLDASITLPSIIWDGSMLMYILGEYFPIIVSMPIRIDCTHLYTSANTYFVALFLNTQHTYITTIVIVG